MPKAKRTSIAIAIFTLIASLLFTTSVFAAGGTYSWLQGTKPELTDSNWEIQASKGKTIIFQGVATSSNTGSFKVKLQRKNIFGVWIDERNIYTVSQHSKRSYDSVNKRYVIGQFYRLYWNTEYSTRYRVVLYEPTNPQVCGLTEVLFYIQ